MRQYVFQYKYNSNIEIIIKADLYSEALDLITTVIDNTDDYHFPPMKDQNNVQNSLLSAAEAKEETLKAIKDNETRQLNQILNEVRTTITLGFDETSLEMFKDISTNNQLKLVELGYKLTNIRKGIKTETIISWR